MPPCWPDQIRDALNLWKQATWIFGRYFQVLVAREESSKDIIQFLISLVGGDFGNAFGCILKRQKRAEEKTGNGEGTCLATVATVDLGRANVLFRIFHQASLESLLLSKRRSRIHSSNFGGSLVACIVLDRKFSSVIPLDPPSASWISVGIHFMSSLNSKTSSSRGISDISLYHGYLNSRPLWFQ